MTAHESMFDRNDILRAWCDHLPAGAPIAELERLVDAFVDRLGVAPSPRSPQRGPVIRDRTGRVLSALPAGQRWTTFDLLNVEQQATAMVRQRLDQHVAVIEPGDVLSVLRAWPTLSDEQVRAVVTMTASGNGVDIVTAPAGAGKTYAFAAARQVWERAGYRVIGAAPTGVAADELATAAGIPSTTIARLRIALDNGEPGGLDPRTVLVIDEAGTAGTRDLAALLDHVARAERRWCCRRPPTAPRDRRGRPVRRADRPATRDRAPRQPPPTRQWERDALRHVRDGDPRWARRYMDHGRITIGETAEETKACSSPTGGHPEPAVKTPSCSPAADRPSPS